MSACEKVNLLTFLLEQVKSNLEVADFVLSDTRCTSMLSLFGVIYNLGLKYWVNNLPYGNIKSKHLYIQIYA